MLFVDIPHSLALFRLAWRSEQPARRMLFCVFIRPEHLESIHHLPEYFPPTSELSTNLQFFLTQSPSVIFKKDIITQLSPHDYDQLLSFTKSRQFILCFKPFPNDETKPQPNNFPSVINTAKLRTPIDRFSLISLFSGAGGDIADKEVMESLLADPARLKTSKGPPKQNQSQVASTPNSDSRKRRRIDDQPAPPYTPTTPSDPLAGKLDEKSSDHKRRRTSGHQSTSLPSSTSAAPNNPWIELDKHFQNELCKVKDSLQKDVIGQVQRIVDRGIEQASHISQMRSDLIKEVRTKLRRTTEQEVKRQTRGVVRRVERKATLAGKRNAEVLRGEARQGFNLAQEALELARGNQKMCDDFMKLQERMLKLQEKMLDSTIRLQGKMLEISKKTSEDSVKRPLAENSEVHGSGP